VYICIFDSSLNYFILRIIFFLQRMLNLQPNTSLRHVSKETIVLLERFSVRLVYQTPKVVSLIRCKAITCTIVRLMVEHPLDGKPRFNPHPSCMENFDNRQRRT